ATPATTTPTSRGSATSAGPCSCCRSWRRSSTRSRSACAPSAADAPPDESDDVTGAGPTGELPSVGQLQLSQHRRDMRLDRALGQDKLLRGLAIGVAAGDQP